jgi:MarR family transcriptional regulator, organic hydroperoxide resistance regulator
VRAYGPLLDEYGLTYPQYIALLALWDEQGGPLTVGQLGARLHLDSGTLKPVLKRLESQGHVVRRRSAADERQVLVELTGQGRALQAEVAGIPSELFSVLGLDRSEAVALRDQLHRLTASVEAHLAASR